MKGKNKECVYVRELLDAFADDELKKKDRIRSVIHLVQCSACRRELVSIRNLVRMLADMPTAAPRLDLELKIEHAVITAWSAQRNANKANRKSKQPGFNLWIKSWTCAACLSGVAVFALGFWSSWSVPEQLLNLIIETTKVQDVLAPSDCYVAHIVPPDNNKLLHLKLRHEIAQ